MSDEPSDPVVRRWWVSNVVVLIVAGVLAVGGVIALLVSERKLAEAHSLLNPTPPPPPPQPPRLTLDDGTEARVKEFFAEFGRRAADRDAGVSTLFDTSELEAAIPERMLDPANDHGNTGAAAAVQDVFSHETYLRWGHGDWGQTDVRKIAVSPDGRAVEVVTWHPPRIGSLKLRWRLRPTATGFKALDWENLRTGVTGTDLAVVQADAFNNHRRNGRLGGFACLDEFYGAVANANDDEHLARVLVKTEGARVEPRLGYACGIAEGIYLLPQEEGLRYAPDERIGEITTTLDVAEELVETTPQRLAAYVLLAEAAVRQDKPHRAIWAADHYMSEAGDDPDALAARAAARLAQGDKTAAAADFEKALALDPHQPLALAWLRMRSAEDAAVVVGRLGTAPNPRTLFESLAADAEGAKDWAGVAALAERYVALRPKELRGGLRLMHARVYAQQPEKAGEALALCLPKLSPTDRTKLVWEFVRAMHRTPLPDVYALVPTSDATTALCAVADRLHLLKNSHPSDKAGRATAVATLRKVLTAHRKVHPEDIWLAVYEGLALNAEWNYAEAVVVLEPALRRLTSAGTAHEQDGTYCALRDELIVAWRETGKAVDAYRQLNPKGLVFERLVRKHPTHHVPAVDADSLAGVLDARKEVEGEHPNAAYWRAEVCRMRGEFAEAVKLYRGYLAGGRPTADDTDWSNLHHQVRPAVIRCLARAGDGAGAVEELDGWVAEDKRGWNEALASTLRVVVWAHTGRKEKAAESLKERAKWSGQKDYMRGLYADPDLGKVLRTDPAFAAFRKDFPPPKE